VEAHPRLHFFPAVISVNGTEMMRKFLASRAGATAIEYGLILALIAVAVLAALPGLSSAIVSIFERLSAEFATNATGTPP